MADQTITPSSERGVEANNHNQTPSPSSEGNGGNKQYKPQSKGISRNKKQHMLSISDKDFEGDTPAIGVIVGLKSERISKKVHFDTFRDKVGDYILKELDHGHDIISYLTDMKDPSAGFVAKYLPKDLTDDEMNSPAKKGVFNEKLKRYVNLEYKMHDNRVKLYTYIWGQCSSGLKSVITGEEKFDEKHGRKDVLWLLERIKLITAGLDVKANRYNNIYECMMIFVTMRQGEAETNSDYLERFKSNAETVRVMCGNDFFVSQEVIGKAFYTESEITESNEKFKAVIMIKRADNKRFSDLKKRLQQANDVGRDEYPTTVAGAYDLLVRTEGQIRSHDTVRNNINRFARNDRSKLIFAQHNKEEYSSNGQTLVPGLDGTVNPRMQCWHCNDHGHGRNNCPKMTQGQTSRRGFNNLMRGFQFAQRGKRSSEMKNSDRFEGIPQSWILLDTCSTVDVTNNPSHVTNILPCDIGDRMEIITNGGSLKYHHHASLKLLPIKMHYNEYSMATIISLATVLDLDGHYAKMDSREELSIIVYRPNGTALRFKQSEEGLYYYDCNNPQAHVFNYSKPTLQQYPEYSLLQTVQSNKEFLNKYEIQGAEAARRQQEIIGWPSTQAFKQYVADNLMNNTLVTVDDINTAVNVHGEPEPLLEGKMTRPKARVVGKIKRVPIPIPIKTKYQDIHMYVDFFFVNKIPFLLTKSGQLNFLTVEKMKARTKGAIIGSIKDTLKIYTNRGLKVSFVHGDGEFDIEDLKREITPVEVVTYGKNEHVHEIEREVRTVKERARCATRAAPYDRYTNLMTTHLVESRVSWLNKFPRKEGASKTISPAGLILGHNKPDMSVKRIPFGAYAMAYTKTTNDMRVRSTPGIALSESNEQGGHYFMSLYTGRRIHAYGWRELPIHQDVIERVEELAVAEDQPVMVDRVPLFEWAPGVPIMDEDEESDDSSYNDSDEEDTSDDESESSGTDNDDEGEDTNVITEEDNDDNDSDESSKLSSSEDEEPMEEENREYDEEDNNALQEEEFIVEDSDDDETEERMVENNKSEETKQHGTNRIRRTNAGAGVQRLEPNFRSKGYSARRQLQYMQFKRKRKKEKVMYIQKLMKKVQRDDKAPAYLKRAVNVIFTQLKEDEQKYKDMPASQGIKLFGERAVAAVIKEFTQLSEGPMPGKPVIEPVDIRTLDRQTLDQALEAVNLIKQKRCGKIKMRSCANGSNQWKFASEDDNFSSPTMQLESLFLSMIIDVCEGRDVAIFDIPGAYLHAEMPKDKMVLMKFRGQFADIMCKVNPEHKKNIAYEKGKKVLYVRVLRAIYGCIESALLWYELYSSTLKKNGFTINPYERCVANKVINGSQCTIAWYVDDNKVSHKDSKVVDKILKDIEGQFGKLSVTRGDEHTFLGMKLKIDRNKKQFAVNMSDQILETIQSFGEEIEGYVASPAAKYLMNVPDDDEKLDEERKGRFHTVVAKLLYIMKRARPDLETAVAFLCTRVSKCSMSDWKKLRRVLQYAKGTYKDERIIGASGLGNIFMFVDASYGIYDNMRGVTGGCMSMGTGMFHGRSSKQKINTKSSTETELVGVSEYLPFNIWALNFLQAQGFIVKTNVLFQDNQGAILMEKNGRNSCTGNSRHINIRYFFVKDRVDKGEISIEYCPTELMIADYFTKPLQGKMFNYFRNIIMGYSPLNDVLEEISIKERVGNHKKVSETELIEISPTNEKKRILTRQEGERGTTGELKQTSDKKRQQQQ